ncbi:MAG: CCA tRNA nucleotidyltransferase [Chloroflexi bacterium]|nr:CCA tRNA nucleotidyltransferase [Chloroflexota bacterium]MYF80193.1 CCA tRNA nucleotidyltransferase [Chloroflexota bacterium]MYI04912.1 CCA tRNA nucleotidyltransferase [Chloroflexota bacterium]
MKHEFPRLRLLDFVRRRSDTTGHLLSTLCQTATARGEPLYVVGGVVRDILLGNDSAPRPALDLDLAVDADTYAYRAAIAGVTGVSATHHERFDTASVTLSDGATVDLARTRAERYPTLGSLPVVEPAPIEIDLGRRDFTMHAAAVALVGPDSGFLLDPFGACTDLESRTIRTLHADSFRDDPTRLIRAAQYAARIGGQIERRTAASARRDRALLGRLSADRFGDAWRRLLQDTAVQEALVLSRRFRIPESREPRWALPSRVYEWPQGAESFWSCVGLTSSDPEIDQWLPRSVGMTRREQVSLAMGAELHKSRRRIGVMSRPSSVAAALQRIPHPTLEAAVQLWDGPSGDAVAMYLTRRESVRAPISASRLSELGIERGPSTGKWLRKLERLVWDNELDPHNPADIALAEERIRLSR